MTGWDALSEDAYRGSHEFPSYGYLLVMIAVDKVLTALIRTQPPSGIAIIHVTVGLANQVPAYI
jgi:hypothetical protein